VGLPGEKAARHLQALERTDAIEAAVRARLLQVFDAQDGHLADGQRTTRTWLVHSTRVTKGQAAEYQALQALARGHQVLLAALAEGDVITKSVALQLAKWTKAIPGEYRGKAEEILVGAARAGADLRSLAATAHAAEATWCACLVSPLAASALTTAASACACEYVSVMERATVSACSCCQLRTELGRTVNIY
jgi:hypothetical protein